MSNRAWGALGVAAVLVTTAGGVDGCARARDGGATGSALSDDAAGDEAELDSADELALVAETEVPEVSSAADAVGDDASIGGDDASQSSDDSGNDSSGEPVVVQDAGPPVVVADSGDNGSPSDAPEASAEAAAVPEAGPEAASPVDAAGGRDTGTPRPSGGLHVANGGPNASGSPGAPAGSTPSFGDDASPWVDAEAMVGGSWGDNDGAAPPAIEMTPPRAVLGCAGCSVPDASGSGVLPWLLVALTMAARALRRR
ncbi:MAG TPA: hypothetical protein VF765_32405 [Polyangiaceae bacterium]